MPPVEYTRCSCYIARKHVESCKLFSSDLFTDLRRAMWSPRIVYGLTVLITALTVVACGTSDGARSSSGGDRNRITAEQMGEVVGQYSTAYEVVQNLRPLWLRKRGRTSFTNEADIAVYVDGSRYGVPNDLRSISVIAIESMRFLTPSEATNRYGTGHTHGAIMVNTKR